MSQPAVRPAPSGPLVWAATFGSIVAWMVHLTAEAALVPAREAHPDVVWLMHGLTVVLALVVLAGMRVSWTLARLGGDREADGDPAGRTVFLGWLGLGIGALNLLLIVYEGFLIVVLDHGSR
jgi:hypothetical protein